MRKSAPIGLLRERGTAIAARSEFENGKRGLDPLLDCLLQLQLGLVGFLVRSLTWQLEFGARCIVLDIVLQVVRTGERLSPNAHLATGRAEKDGEAEPAENQSNALFGYLCRHFPQTPCCPHNRHTR